MASKIYIKERYIYYVEFSPIKSGEFGSPHLAIVLRLNKDKKAALVVPLTSAEDSQPDSDKSNKINLGKLQCLPERLHKKNTYAVLDHARSVSFDRFSPIREGEVELDDDSFKLIVSEYLSMLLLIFNQTDQKDFLFENYENLAIKDLLNKAYSIKKMRSSQSINTEAIEFIKKEILSVANKTIDISKCKNVPSEIIDIINEVLVAVNVDDDQEQTN